MRILYHRCCGIDVHKKMISDLFRLREWLEAQRCQAVAMESTGVYWKCIWNVLEGEMELLLCNAQHMKAVPGRKVRREVV